MDDSLFFLGLVLSGYKHYRINHSEEFVRNNNHINGIESFWSYVKRKMRKHNGIARHKFYLYLKESEFRFNNRDKNLYSLLLTDVTHVRKMPKTLRSSCPNVPLFVPLFESRSRRNLPPFAFRTSGIPKSGTENGKSRK